jgi:CheY-like chemotaxis protein
MSESWIGQDGRSTERPAASERQRRARVLVLDDHKATRDLCAGYCDLFDHACEVAGGVAEAVAALRREPFDAVVMNVHMQACDGLSLLGAIRGVSAVARRTPVIGLTAIGRGDEAQRWLAAGLTAVVAKPVTAARLHAALSVAAEAGADPVRSWAPTA